MLCQTDLFTSPKNQSTSPIEWRSSFIEIDLETKVTFEENHNQK